MIEIRAARPEEHDALGALCVAAYKALGPLEAEYAEELRDVAGRAAVAEVLVAVEDATVLGCVTYIPDRANPLAEFEDEDAASFRMLAVDPERGGRGAGRALVEACLERARAAGRGRVVLHTRPTMRRAQRLYEQAGFRRDRARDWTPVPGIELWGYEAAFSPRVSGPRPGGPGRTLSE